MHWPKGKRRASGIPPLTGILVCCFFTCIVFKLKQECCWRIVPPRETERKKTNANTKKREQQRAGEQRAPHSHAKPLNWYWRSGRKHHSALGAVADNETKVPQNIHNQPSVCPWKNPNLVFFVPWTIVTLHYTVGNDWPGFPLPLALITEDEYELTNGVYNLV